MSTVVTEVPSSLKRLVRLVMRGFYTAQHDIVMNYLMRNPCMKEDDLAKLLKFERKQMRSVIEELKKDKFVQVRLRRETGAGGKTTNENYYYINYKMFVNVLKYKLDHMRKKIETEEKDFINRTSFKCSGCPKTYTDLEVKDIFNFVTGEWQCPFCGAEVEETLQKADSGLLLARFNEQMTPLYDLLKVVDDVKLPLEILEPEPFDVTQIKKNATGNITANPPSSSTEVLSTWRGDAILNNKHNFENSQGITVSFVSDDSSGIIELQEKKEQNIWMGEHTIKTESTDNSEYAMDKDRESNIVAVTNSASSTKSDDIMATLLVHERIDPKTKCVKNDDDSSSEVKDSVKSLQSLIEPIAEDEELESDEEDNWMVRVGDKKYELHDVTDELVRSMTPEEEEAYIILSQEFYAFMDE